MESDKFGGAPTAAAALPKLWETAPSGGVPFPPLLMARFRRPPTRAGVGPSRGASATRPAVVRALCRAFLTLLTSSAKLATLPLSAPPGPTAA